jgi:TetR/AcrR family transcriptional regulator, fatty acid metabolism regulator protein
VASGEVSETKGSKRDRILEAAVVVFAHKGFHHARIAEIAGEADVASGTIYLYFKNKDDILISLFEESLDRITRELAAELVKIDDPREKLRHFISRHLGLLRDRKELAEVLQVELRQSHKFMKEYEPTRWVQYLDLIAGILKEGQKRGDFRKDLRLGIFKRAVFGALDEIALHYVMTNRGAKEGEYLREAADQLTAIMIEGARANHPAAPAPSARTGRKAKESKNLHSG